MSNLLKDDTALMEEWDYEKNAPLTPNNVTAGSKKKVWWKCLYCGHEWQSRITNRNHGTSCPKCFESKRREYKE